MWKMVEILRRFVGEADAVFYIDSDAVFNKPEQSLEWLFSYTSAASSIDRGSTLPL